MEWEKIFMRVRERAPLVHCITNAVTVNDCANIVLAAGGSPTMANNPAEVEEITARCDALVLNLGQIDEVRMEAMLLAGRRANALGHPVILDPVGVGASRLRTETAARLLEEVRFALIRGNASEILALSGRGNGARGVDASADDLIREENLRERAAAAAALSRETGAVVAVSGVIDLVAGMERTAAVRNGHPMMARITGSGCMLGCLAGVFLGAGPELPFEAAAAAVMTMGICGEIAAERALGSGAGTGSFRMHLLDAVSTLSGTEFEERQKLAYL